MLNNQNKMTLVKEQAFKNYCALSFEQQLYSIIKYGLKDIDTPDFSQLQCVEFRPYSVSDTLLRVDYAIRLGGIKDEDMYER